MSKKKNLDVYLAEVFKQFIAIKDDHFKLAQEPSEDYMRWFCKVESFINDIKGVVFIVGDINLNSASVNVNNYYCFFLTFCNLTEINGVPNAYGGMLDIVLVQESSDVYEARVQAMDGLVKTDAPHPYPRHSTAHQSDRIEPSNIDPCKDWNFKKGDYNLLYLLLSETSWHELFKSNDVQSSTEQFCDAIYNLFDICIPMKRRYSLSSTRYPVWFTCDIIRDIKLKLKLHSSWKQHKREESYEAFSRLRASLKSRISFAHEAYLRSIEDDIISNPRGFWQHVSSLRSKGGFEPCISYKGETFSGVEASEAFARFFASVFHPDVPRLDADSANQLDGIRSSNYVNIFEFTPSDVAFGIKNLKPGSVYESLPYHTRSGVSQGSILGPLLFILMVNDLPAVANHAKCLLYADDLN
ncbi:hypothetical protein OBRU01_05434 [Operophtera brumata]|uniref:Reverse transcriptase domain-containing protein n=1 Tax=Operophtera brumata TaxID=104452 RepID=A0A0L7LMG7_OPEBR|nr:hypothetical protein OBRU01_05434 [Operophtera brumata]